MDIYTMGVDIGSSASKAVILRNGETVAARAIEPFGTGTEGPQRVYEAVLSQTGKLPEEISRIVVTGYGRMNFPYSSEQLSELSCHARGVGFLMPTVRTLVDIGGQDLKVLKIGPGGRLLNFQMNEKCAAGTGRFLEVMARVLGVSIEELGPISERAQHPVSISNTCTVFAESEVISQLASGAGREDIAAGIHQSVAKRAAGMLKRVGLEPEIGMSGGVAQNIGVVHAMEHELKMSVLTHPDSQLAGAIGAALVAYERLRA